MSADIIDWLRSPEGEEWSRTRFAYQPTSGPPIMYQHDPGDPAEDPCGRPPLPAGEIAAADGRSA